MKINKIKFDSLDSLSSLCELGSIYNTDKSPISKMELRHSYTMLYDFIFGKFKYDKIRIAEIGIWKNSSLKCFRDYFPEAEIFGFEKIDHIIQEAKLDEIRDTQYFTMDCENSNSIINAFEKSGGNFDVVIDDASHYFEHQINVLLHSAPYLKPGGILIIEDIFKSIDEKDFEETLNQIKKYYHSLTFVETYHQLQYTGQWNNDKLLVLYRNNLVI